MYLQKQPITYTAALLIGEQCKHETFQKVDEKLQSMCKKEAIGYIRVNCTSHPALVVDVTKLDCLNSEERKLAERLIAINGLQEPWKCRKVTNKAVIEDVVFENVKYETKDMTGEILWMACNGHKTVSIERPTS